MGSNQKKKQAFNIPEPEIQINAVVNELSKYQIGAKGYSLHDIKKLKPVFAFDYLSLNATNLCYNNAKLKVEDFIGLLEGLKKISTITYNDLTTIKVYRFHKIDFDEHNVTISRKQFKAILTHKVEDLSDDELPTLYQFDLHYVQEARACGFLFKGIFYLVWYDRFHQIYKKA